MTEREEQAVPEWVGQEQTHYALATAAAEVMCALFEADYQAGEGDLDAMMMRLKDLSAYSLSHAEIMVQREGVELLALAKFFGMTTDPAFHRNQARLHLLSEEVLTYHGQAEIIEQGDSEEKRRPLAAEARRPARTPATQVILRRRGKAAFQRRFARCVCFRGASHGRVIIAGAVRRAGDF